LIRKIWQENNENNEKNSHFVIVNEKNEHFSKKSITRLVNTLFSLSLFKRAHHYPDVSHSTSGRPGPTENITAVALVAVSVTGLCERFIAIRFYSFLLLLLLFFYYFSFNIIRSLLIIFRSELKERKQEKKRNEGGNQFKWCRFPPRLLYILTCQMFDEVDEVDGVIASESEGA
jgi:hypothetical protein